MKKILAFLLSAILTVGLVSTAYAAEFTDVDSSYWAYSYISELSDRGVISGYEDGSFQPENTVTRAEFDKILLGVLGINAPLVTATSFSDVSPSEWYAPFVEAAKEYLDGYGSYYNPDGLAAREDIAVAIVKAKGIDVSGIDASYLLSFTFSDYASISPYAAPFVKAAVDYGYINGYEDGTFGGKNGITRAETAALLHRLTAYRFTDAAPVAGSVAGGNPLGNLSSGIDDDSFRTTDGENIYYFGSDEIIYKVDANGNTSRYTNFAALINDAIDDILELELEHYPNLNFSLGEDAYTFETYPYQLVYSRIGKTLTFGAAFEFDLGKGNYIQTDNYFFICEPGGLLVEDLSHKVYTGVNNNDDD